MKRALVVLTVVGVVLLLGIPAGATTVDFENPSVNIFDNVGIYEGFVWTTFWWLPESTYKNFS